MKSESDGQEVFQRLCSVAVGIKSNAVAIFFFRLSKNVYTNYAKMFHTLSTAKCVTQKCR